MPMSIIGAPSGAVPSAAAIEIARETAVMKKTRDVEQQAAAALIDLVSQAAPSVQGRPGAQGARGTSGRIDTYA